MRFRQYILIGILCIFTSTNFAADLELNGQASGYFIANPDHLDQSLAGLRYLPTFTLDQTFSENLQFTSAFTWNLTGSAYGNETVSFDSHSKPYRFWMRLATPQFETRLGLQKINFGSAVMFRPLMWFDQIDPRDPLQITDGVYAMLMRYTFLNNTNLWFWSLYGNDNPRGWDVLGSDPDRIELGGRIQLPIRSGEIALSWHQRHADPNTLGIPLPLHLDAYKEQKFGLDCKWDWKIGLWLETSLNHQDYIFPDLEWQRLTTVGVDYTFNLGNGLYFMTEYFNYTTSDAPFSKGDGLDFSALSANYPLGLLDTVTGMVYYDWDNHDWYRFVNFQRSLDNWQFYLMLFWNPEQLNVYGLTDSILFADKGFQIMIVFNH